MEAGYRGVSARAVMLGELVDEIRALAEPLITERGLDFRVSVPSPEAPLFTDPEKLRRVTLNLLSNAAKFTARGHVELTALLDGNDLVVTVADTGQGIPEANLERIFESFWVAERPLIRSVGGTGVGLSVGRQLARLLGGSLSVKSTLGVGTTFTLRVPARLGE
jgi:signal transduction histidine kinase